MKLTVDAVYKDVYSPLRQNTKNTKYKLVKQEKPAIGDRRTHKYKYMYTKSSVVNSWSVMLVG